MGKLDELRREARANVDESMGAGRPPGRSGPAPTAGADRWRGIARAPDVVEIPVDRIVRDPSQPREEFDLAPLAHLADSLRKRGQLQPIRVRWDEGQGVYVVLVGERRWRAARMAELPTITAVVVEGEVDTLAIQMIENCLRADLKPIEQAKAFRALMDRNGWNGKELARELDIDPATVTRALALLELPAPVQEQVEQGALAPATAYELSKVDDPDTRAELAERVVAEGLSRDEAVEAVRKVAGRPKGRGAGKAKAKGRAARLPAELKHRDPNGVRIVATTAARHSHSDVIAALEAFLTRLKAERDGDDRRAA